MSRPDDPEIPASAIATYVKRRADDHASCRDALARGDLGTIERLAHRMKGNGATFGFGELSELGARLEEAAAQGDRGKCEAELKRWEEWLGRRTKPASGPSG